MKDKVKNLKLKGAIITKGYTYESLSYELGISKDTINRAVNGGSIHLHTAQEISKALGVDLNELFGN